MNCKEIDLNQVIARQAAGLRDVLGNAATLALVTTSEPAKVFADESMMGQIVFSLATALQATAVTLQTESFTVDETHARLQPGARPGEFIRLSVSGGGTRTEAIPATGRELSLPVITGVLRRRHGWLETTRSPDGNSSFRCLLPLASPLEAACAACAREHVLLVEDEGDMRDMLCHILQRASYDVLPAETGPQALALWTEHHGGVDLLLTDMIMPGGVNGRELANRLRAVKPLLKVIYTSGYELDPHAQHDCALGSAEFLQKPYEVLTLLEAVQHAISAPTATTTPS
jgi:two-component system, cell cycle sensor histidine kinase and response regulator CckA